MANGHENINNLILEEGFKQAIPGEWESQLTGEETTNTLLDAILTTSGVGGMLTKGRKGLQLIPKAQWEKVFGSKVVDKASEGVRQLALAMKGKIKDGRLISDQPFKQGMIGKPSSPLSTKLKSFFDKADYSLESVASTNTGRNALIKHFESGKKGHPFIKRPDGTYFIKPKNLDLKKYTLDSQGNRVKNPNWEKLEKPSFNVDVGGWKNVAPLQAKKIQRDDRGKWGLAGLLGLIGLIQDDQGGYIGEDSAREVPSSKLNQILEDVTFSDIINKLIPDPDMSGARNMPIGQTDLLDRYIDPNYYEGETPLELEELAKIIQEQEVVNYPQNFSNRARSWAK